MLRALKNIEYPNRKGVIIALCIWFGYTILANLQYLPGPNQLRNPASIAQFFSELFRFFIILSPLGIAMLMIEVFKRKKITMYSIAICLLTMSFSVNHYVVAPVFQFIAGEYTIRESEFLLHAIDRHKSDSGTYPDSLQHLVPKYIEDIREPLIIDVSRYYWGNRDSAFSLSFVIEVGLLRYRHFVFRPDTISTSEYQKVTYHKTTKQEWMYYEYDF